MKLTIQYKPPWAWWYTKMHTGFICHVGPFFIGWQPVPDKLQRAFDASPAELAQAALKAAKGDQK